MTDAWKKDFYAEAWHGEKEYTPEECLRLERACEMFLNHAARKTVGDGQSPYRLLDVGCGVGPLHRWLPADRFEITGLEISEQAAELAREHYADCKVMDVETDWPVEPGASDGCHMGAIMEHVLDWHAPLNQANRALSDGGLLVISVPNLRYWREIRRLLMGRQPHWISDMGHIHAYTPKFLQQLVTIHGFAIESFQADRLRLPLLPRLSRFGTKRLARFGAVMVLAARRVRTAHVEDATAAARYPNHNPVGLRSIEILQG